MKPAPPGLHRFELVVFAGFEPTYSQGESRSTTTSRPYDESTAQLILVAEFVDGKIHERSLRPTGASDDTHNCFKNIRHN